MAISKEEKEILEDLEIFIAGGNLSQERIKRVAPYALENDALQNLRERAGATQEETEIRERQEEREEINPEKRTVKSEFSNSEILVNPGGNIFYVPGAEIGVERFLNYVSEFRESLGEKFWRENVVPPLRMAFSELFKTGGGGQWKELSIATQQMKHDPVEAYTDDRKERSVKVKDPKASGGYRIERRGSFRVGLRPQSKSLRAKKNIGDILFYRGRYRGALTKSNANLNRDGNLFQPIGGSWKKGFRFGIDQSWFNAFTRRTRGNPTIRGKQYPELELDYPSKHETGGRAQFLYYWMVTKINYKNNTGAGRSVTVKGKRTKRKRKEQIQDREQHKVVVTPAQARHLPKRIAIHLSKPAHLPARPIFSFFKTSHSIIDKFAERVERNVAKNLGRYLDEGKRKQWYGERDAQGLIPEKLGHLYTEGFRQVPESVRRRAGPRDEFQQRVRQTDASQTRQQRHQELESKLTAREDMSEAEIQEYYQLERDFDQGGGDDDDIGFDETFGFDDLN